LFHKKTSGRPGSYFEQKHQKHISRPISDYKQGLPDFSWYNIPKWVNVYIRNYQKIYQMAIIPRHQMALNGQITIKYTKISHTKAFKNMPNFGFFGLQIYHLATLLQIGIPASACSMAASS
jgi:hypothetical protein